MFIKPQEKIEVEELRVKLEKPVIEDLQQYAKANDSSVSYVVQEILRKVFISDKDFRAQVSPDAGKPAKAARAAHKGATA